MKLSVITVCYNAEKDIEKTILSVIRQSYKDFEYIVIDGQSADGTMDIVNRYADKITRVVSEPDTGIYNAMNKGVRLATGEYCIFMNAGDTFAGAEVLERVVPFLTGEYDVVVGREISIRNDRIVGHVYPPKRITAMHFYRSSLSHQSAFIRREALLRHPYDETLRLVSDWKFWIEMLVSGKLSYCPIDVNVCCFNQDGATYTQLDLGKKERTQVLNECLPAEVLSQCRRQAGRFSLSWFLFRIFRRIRRDADRYRLRRYQTDWYRTEK